MKVSSKCTFPRHVLVSMNQKCESEEKGSNELEFRLDVSKMSSHPYYACSRPATDTSMTEHIGARRFATLSTGKLVCFLTCKLHAGCCWEPVNQWHVKLNFHRLLTLHPTLHTLTSFRLISRQEQTLHCPGMLSHLLEKLNLLCSRFFFFFFSRPSVT